MFIDKAKIYIKAGNGGDGCTSFYTEKYISKGGPDGGDGGKGGDIVFEADSDKASLMDFQYSQHFRADDGERGSGKFCHGKSGKDLVIKVPQGTVIKDFETGKIIADMFDKGQRVIVLNGGNGGKGNARFKSARRQSPHFSQKGEITEEHAVTLELKIIADVSLIGYPNVGKSTLISVMSNARPKIANYHFTTLSPNLGVVKYYETSFVIADIPGLIEGAGEGAGLGHEFLRHIERTRMLVHVVDIAGTEGREPIEDFKIINAELKKYSKYLASLPQIVALNKCDALENRDAVKEFKRHTKKKCVEVSAITRDGINDLIAEICKMLETLPPISALEYEPFVYEKKDKDSYFVERADDGAFEVFGGMIEELARNVVLDDFDSLRYFHKKMKDSGIIKTLRNAGAKDGDIVRVLDIEFEFIE